MLRACSYFCAVADGVKPPHLWRNVPTTKSPFVINNSARLLPKPLEMPVINQIFCCIIKVK